MPVEIVIHKIILFDGVCNFCNGSVNFVIDRDPKGKFKFAALQSETGMFYLNQLGIETGNFDSIILIDGEKYFRKSTAALRIAKALTGLWPLFYYVFAWLPASFRDFFYDLIARNRYHFFGRSESCRMPTPALKSRFI